MIDIRQGDAYTILKTLPDNSVHCCVTSPPYWGLRDYGVPGQIGLEASPMAYILKMVRVFREVRRVLRKDGTAWVNMGDCYATGAGKVGEHPGGGERGARWKGDIDRIRDEKRGYRGDRLEGGSAIEGYRYRGNNLPNSTTGAVNRPKTRADRDGTHAGKHTAITAMGPMTQPNRMPIPGLKPKDLVGMPWRLAFALQNDGWYLRQDIIWNKPNPMPESVRDRCTKSHEYLFLLSKSERYYYDYEAISEPVAFREYKTPDGWDTSVGAGGHGAIHRQGREDGFTGYAPKVPDSYKGSVPGRRDGPGQDRRSSNDRVSRSGNKERKPGSARGCPEDSGKNVCGSVPWEGTTRNKRSVWTIGTEPFPEAHFATFPTELVKPCILAGCPIGGTVLDPFGGAMTTMLVAKELHCEGIAIELNPEYIEIGRRRLAQDVLSF